MSPDSLETVPCNLCGSARSRVVYHRPYRIGAARAGDFAATTDQFHAYGRIVRCQDCGLVYTSPRPAPGALVRGYADCVDETYREESSSRSINAHLSLRTIRRFVGSGRLLEVGAYAGFFLNSARAEFEVLGVEPSEWACRVARERFRLDMIHGSLEQTPIKRLGTQDAAAMIDVIEHLADPRAALEKLSRVLRPGGLLYLVTPDIGSLSARLLRGYWWGFRPAHIYYFDRRTLGRMLEEAGFELVLARSFGRIFSYGYWLSRLRHYPAMLYHPIRKMIELLGLQDKLLYLDTRDSMEICARRR